MASKRGEKLADIFGHLLRLLHGGKAPSCQHRRPTDQVVGALAPSAAASAVRMGKVRRQRRREALAGFQAYHTETGVLVQMSYWPTT
jgi:hypothetical protein